MLKEKLIYLPVGVLAILTAVSGVLLVADGVSAEVSNTQSVTGKITVETACTMSGVVNSAHTATMLNGTYQQGIGTTTLTANCNDENGYSIYAIGFSNDTFGNTNMIGTNGLTFPTGTATSGDTSNWAMRVSAVSGNTAPVIQGGFGNYSAVPTDYTMVASEENATDGTNGSSIQTTYAVYVSGSQGAGTYTGKVKYSLVHPGGGQHNPPVVYVMQEMSAAQCQAVASDAPATVIDIRDNNLYTVRYINGNCWMTQNLRLAGGVTITSDDSNITTAKGSYTLPASTGNTAAGESSWSDSYNVAYMHEPSEAELSTLSGKSITAGQAGYYYNYCAATAGERCEDSGTNGGEATMDICPKGWRLPTGYNTETVDGVTVNGEQKSLTAGKWQSYDKTYSHDANGTAGVGSFTPVAAGYYGNGVLGNAGYDGYWWSSSAPDAIRRYYLNYYPSGGLFSGRHLSRFYGISVRCILALAS